MTYLLLKHLHVACVLLSGGGFVLRGVWMLLDSRHLQRPLVRTLPHVVDTLLLGSAVAMVVLSEQYPWRVPWLAAKVIALFCYIGLGSMALKRAPTRLQRAACFVAALATFAYIVSVALARDARGFLVWLG